MIDLGQQIQYVGSRMRRRINVGWMESELSCDCDRDREDDTVKLGG